MNLSYRAICIDNNGVEHLLDLGKEYCLTKSYGDRVFTNIVGSNWFYESRFRKIEEESVQEETFQFPFSVICIHNETNCHLKKGEIYTVIGSTSLFFPTIDSYEILEKKDVGPFLMWRFEKVKQESVSSSKINEIETVKEKQPLVLVSSVPAASISSLLYALKEKYPQQNFAIVLNDITIENGSHTLIKKAEHFIAGFLAAIP